MTKVADGRLRGFFSPFLVIITTVTSPCDLLNEGHTRVERNKKGIKACEEKSGKYPTTVE
jgi:hypothetical protein